MNGIDVLEIWSKLSKIVLIFAISAPISNTETFSIEINASAGQIQFWLISNETNGANPFPVTFQKLNHSKLQPFFIYVHTDRERGRERDSTVPYRNAYRTVQCQFKFNSLTFC